MVPRTLRGGELIDGIVWQSGEDRDLIAAPGEDLRDAGRVWADRCELWSVVDPDDEHLCRLPLTPPAGHSRLTPAGATGGTLPRPLPRSRPVSSRPSFGAPSAP